jgi:hypothetical protein
MKFPSRLAAIALVTCTVALFGCEGGDTGFVQIDRSIALNRDDVLILNSVQIPNIAQKATVVYKQPVGKASVFLKRGDSTQKLCEVQVRKNRIVIVTLTFLSGTVRCSTQT